LVGLGALAVIALACTCGPINTVLGLGATAQSARGTVGAVATEFGAGLPTIQAVLTDVGPTLEAQMTEGGPTLEALQTQSGDLLPTIEAQLTAVLPGLLGGEVRQWAARASASTEYGNPDWSASQATGAADTPDCGDYPTAWASSASNGVDWLRLEYDVPVTAKQIEIHQSLNPGAINQVDVTIQGGGVTQIVYQAEPQVIEECPYVLVIPVSGLDTKIGEVIVYLDQTNHPGWNEIDAVELIGTP
jgi:hypothetical protein